MLACAALMTIGGAGALAADEGVPDLNGFWQWGRCTDGSGIQCQVLEEDDYRLTDRARGYRDAIDEIAQPKYDCAPMSIPHMWTDPYSHQIEQLEDRVIFRYGKDDVERTVWLEGHGHPTPALNQFFVFGHSVGRYEDNALIVETSRFVFDPQGLNADFRLASSTQKRVTEHYSRDGDDLILKVTTEDSIFLREPWVYEVRSAPEPGPVDLSWNCDPEAGRSILPMIPSVYPDDPEITRIPQ